MASKTTMRLLTSCRPLAMSVARPSRWSGVTRSAFSTDSPPPSLAKLKGDLKMDMQTETEFKKDVTPPLLAKLRGDLKQAMRLRDTARLVVLRSVIAASLEASKCGTRRRPISDDGQMVAILLKIARTCKESAAEFREAGRQDLVDKEEAQIRVIEEYVAESGIERIGMAKLREVVEQVKSEFVAKGEKPRSPGTVMGKLLAPDGPLAGKSFDKGALAPIVKEVFELA